MFRGLLHPSIALVRECVFFAVKQSKPTVHLQRFGSASLLGGLALARSCVVFCFVLFCLEEMQLAAAIVPIPMSRDQEYDIKM